MVLSTSSVFKAREADVSDGGYLAVNDGSNLATGAVISGDIKTGSMFAMFDLSDTTYCSTIDGGGNHTYYITFDLLKKYTNVVVSCYYAAQRASAGSTTVITWETSNDNSSWTAVDTVTASGATATEVTRNWSEQIASLRYLRLKDATTGTDGTDPNGGKIYNIQIYKS